MLPLHIVIPLVLLMVFIIMVAVFDGGPVVHCLMVTGKDVERVRMARTALVNFQQQTYGRKRLIIVNEHPTETVVPDPRAPPPGVTEIWYDRSRGGASLGGMRNVALDAVPEGDFWITWDDDDYRHETFLSALVERAGCFDADAVFHVRRFEHNVNTGFTWGYARADGLWIVLVRKRGGSVRYREVDQNEDRDVREQIKESACRWCVWDNPPHIYIRTIHGRNTNTTVSPTKHALTGYGDFEVSAEDRAYVRDKLQQCASSQRRSSTEQV